MRQKYLTIKNLLTIRKKYLADNKLKIFNCGTKNISAAHRGEEAGAHVWLDVEGALWAAELCRVRQQVGVHH